MLGKASFSRQVICAMERDAWPSWVLLYRVHAEAMTGLSIEVWIGQQSMSSNSLITRPGHSVNDFSK